MDIVASTRVKRKRPTLAILTYEDETRVFRGNQENFVDLIRTGEALGVNVYVMTTSEFKLSGTEASGYSYNSRTKKWSKGRHPLPDVIYNRIPYRKFELLPEVQQLIQSCMRNKRIRFFNPSFFNKWTLFEWLNKSKTTRPFIPATQRLQSGNELEKLLQDHAVVYLKPVKGKAGKGIMKVSRIRGKTESPAYELSIQEKLKSHISRYSGVGPLWNELEALVGSKEYIVQQGISLATYKQRPFDLRVLVQKNGKARWSVAGVGARLAGKSSITTHVPRGGSIDDPARLLGASFGAAEAKRILRKTRAAALTLARQIEKASGQTLGEMSMDLGVDLNGQLWFFEANSKPMKFDEPHIRQKSLENLIRYSVYLSQRRLSAAARTAAAPAGQRPAARRRRAGR